jgi:hypothetical protein
MRLSYLLCFLVLFINDSYATLFVPLPIDKQVEEANAAAEVKLESARSFRDDRGMTMTEYRFNVLDSFSLAPEDLDAGQLVMTMMGGTFEGMTSYIDGAPKFQIGKRNFLLLKKIQSKYYLSNFTLGQYDIVLVDGKDVLVSEVFPQDPKVGRISKEKMIELIKEKWKISHFLAPKESPSQMKIVNNKMVASPPNAPKIEARSPAQDESATESTPMFFWWALAFVTGFFSLFFIKMSTHRAETKSE